jgi:farnesyl-diphosphate farnesyltransferase
MALQDDAINTLRETSRTFFISIVRLPPGLREAVMSAYLCLRAIDEIEDHPLLGKNAKTRLLIKISLCCQMKGCGEVGCFSTEYARRHGLPEVTRRIGDWMKIAPASIAPRIQDATASTALRMAHWVRNDWLIRTREDLDCYTFGVAGAVGILLSDLWAWYDGTQTDRGQAVAFGRGLQAVNILKNRSEDLNRGVNFFPNGWCEEDVREYASSNLLLAGTYVESLQPGHVREFCRLPLALAHATIEALSRGEFKLNRDLVIKLARMGR